MRKRIKTYIDFIDKILHHELPITTSFDINGQHNKPAKKDYIPTRKEYEALISRHMQQIEFFQHERLVHLLVTLLFAILTFAVLFISLLMPSVGIFILFGFLLILLVPYIMHYYLLENSVQKMYEQYDEMIKQLLQ